MGYFHMMFLEEREKTQRLRTFIFVGTYYLTQILSTYGTIAA